MSEVRRWKLKGFIPGIEGESKAVFQPTVVLEEDYAVALAREAALREELDLLTASALSVRDEWRKDQQRLTVAEQRASEMTNALARIQGRADMFIDDGMHMPTPSIEVIRDIAAKAALKPAEAGEGS